MLTGENFEVLARALRKHALKEGKCRVGFDDATQRYRTLPTNELSFVLLPSILSAVKSAMLAADTDILRERCCVRETAAEGLFKARALCTCAERADKERLAETAIADEGLAREFRALLAEVAELKANALGAKADMSCELCPTSERVQGLYFSSWFNAEHDVAK